MRFPSDGTNSYLPRPDNELRANGFPGGGAGFFPGDSSFVDQDLLERAAGLQPPPRADLYPVQQPRGRVRMPVGPQTGWSLRQPGIRGYHADNSARLLVGRHSVETCPCGVCSRRAREWTKHCTGSEYSRRRSVDTMMRLHGSRSAQRARDLWNKQRRANKWVQMAEDRAARHWDAPGAPARSRLHGAWSGAARASSAAAVAAAAAGAELIAGAATAAVWRAGAIGRPKAAWR